MRDPRHAGDWLREYLTEGTLAAAAWFGYLRLPKFGLYRILERLEMSPVASSLRPVSERTRTFL